jgi:small subunit ribosomal protein S6
MFLVDNARAKESPEAIAGELREMVVRVGGEVINCDKWDERKLAYEVARQRRGTYMLCHWNGPPDGPAKLERSCQLADAVLRVLTVVDQDGTETARPREEVTSRRDGEGESSGSYGRRSRR